MNVFSKLLLVLNTSLLLNPLAGLAADFRYAPKPLLSLEQVSTELAPAKENAALRVQPGPPLVLEGEGEFTTEALPVEAGAEYLFRARIRSKASVVVRLGGFSMAYNDIGQWQTVTGLYRAVDPARSHLRVILRSLAPGETAQAEIESLSLTQVERPKEIGRRSHSGETALVAEGKANATLVIPANAPGYAAQAARIRDAVKEATGVELPIATDLEATETDYPILKPAYRNRHLILLGRLGNNRAFWPSYNRFLTAVDGYYPGGDGYALHTAANVFHTGENHLIIGGTSDRGVERGVDAFLKVLASHPSQSGSLRLPWLLECDPQGECLAFLKADDARWSNPDDPLLPKPEPGYGNVVRWYWNVFGYYWTGWESYRQRADHYLAQVLREKAYTHHYIMEFFVRAFDMLDESGRLTPQQVAGVDALFLHNFLNIMTVDDLSWMSVFAPPYGQIGIVNRHQIAPWMGDYQYARFIDETLAPEGGLGELAHFRRMEKERAFDDFLLHRNNPSLPSGVLDEAYEEINATFFRYALEGDRYVPFFSNGNAQKALALERINHVNGQLSHPSGNRDLHLPLGILTSLTGDPELHWLWANLPERIHVRGYFQNRYLGKIRRYTPDASLPKTVPTRETGIRFTANPVANAPRKATPENYYFVAIREGFTPKDDYLAFNGAKGKTPPGSLVSLLSDGVVWLDGGKPGGARFGSNTATVTRTDAPATPLKRSDLSRCVWSAELPTGEALRFQQPLSNEVEWTRDVIRLGHGRFVFRDRFTANQAGTYLLSVGWHPAGNGSRSADGGYRFITRDGKLNLRVLGTGFDTTLDDGAVRVSSLRPLGRGESATVYTVLQSDPAHAAAALPAALDGEDRLRIGTGADQTTLAWDLSAAQGAPYTAGLAIQTAEQIGLYNGIAASATGKRQSTLLSGEEAAVLARTLAQPPPATPAKTPASADLRVAIHDATARWKQAWHYDGFLKPARVIPTLRDGVADFGEPVDLAEIRAQSSVNYFQQGRLPETLLLSADGKEWKPATGSRKWRPGVRTANYGEAHPEPQTDETLFPDNAAAVRFVKTEGHDLLYFSRSQKTARHPIRLEQGDFLGTGELQTLVVSDVFPQFPRPLRQDDLSLALLDAGGKPLFQKDLAGPVQAIRTLERKQGGGKEIFVLYANGTLEILGFDGNVKQRADIYQLHQEFAAKYRDRATRAPAGGYVLPFAIGLWRPNAEGESRVIISRYGGFTFLNPDLSFEGVLNVSGYGTPGILAHGADFGSGQQEQVVAERLRIWQLGGDGTPTVRPPGDPQFWKQSYHLLKSIAEDEESISPLAGYPILRFELLSRLTQTPRYVLLARGGSICLYDAQARVFRYEWDAHAPLNGVAVLEESPGRLRLLAAAANSLLWEIDFRNGPENAPTLNARQLPFPVASLRESGPGAALLAGAEGIYRTAGQGVLEKVASGAWQNAIATGGKEATITAVTAQGEVISLLPANR